MLKGPQKQIVPPPPPLTSPFHEKEKREREEAVTIHIVISKAGSIYLGGDKGIFTGDVRYPPLSGNS